MGNPSTPAARLTQGERRVIASFLAGRLPAGQLHGDLCRAREAALAQAERSAPAAQPVARPAPAQPAPALQPA